MPSEEYDIQFTVTQYKKKLYISHLAALAIMPSQQATMLIFGNRTLVEVKPKEKHLIEKYPMYDMDSVLQYFVEPTKETKVYKVNRKDCFEFDGMIFISLSKLQIKNKYQIRFSLPFVKIFGTYYILCGKQKDVNTRIAVITE